MFSHSPIHPGLPYIKSICYTLAYSTCISHSELSNCTTGDVQLFDGGYYYGLVHVCIESTWRSVCRDTYWDNADASVICGQLGFSKYGIMFS